MIKLLHNKPIYIWSVPYIRGQWCQRMYNVSNVFLLYRTKHQSCSWISNALLKYFLSLENFNILLIDKHNPRHTHLLPSSIVGAFMWVRMHKYIKRRHKSKFLISVWFVPSGDLWVFRLPVGTWPNSVTHLTFISSNCFHAQVIHHMPTLTVHCANINTRSCKSWLRRVFCCSRTWIPWIVVKA